MTAAASQVLKKYLQCCRLKRSYLVSLRVCVEMFFLTWEQLTFQGSPEKTKTQIELREWKPGCFTEFVNCTPLRFCSLPWCGFCISSKASRSLVFHL